MRVSMMLCLLGAFLMMPACATFTTDRKITETETSTVRRMCTESWLPTSHASTSDTSDTVDSSRANNRRRAAFCAGVE